MRNYVQLKFKSLLPPSHTRKFFSKSCKMGKNFPSICSSLNATMWKSDNFSSTHILCEITFYEVSKKSPLDNLNLDFCQIVRMPKCENYGNLLSHFFGKSFVTRSFYQWNYYINSFFDEIFLGESRFIIVPYCGCTLHTVEKREFCNTNIFVK